MTHDYNTDDRIYDTTTGWQADPGTGLNLVKGKTTAQPVDHDRITTLKHDVQDRYRNRTSSRTDHRRTDAEQRAIDRLKHRAADQPDIPKVAAAKDTSLDQFGAEDESS